MSRSELLRKLADDYGFDDVMDMMEAATFDSVAPAICTTPGCGYTTNMEPDQDRGWCEACAKNTVVSCLILGGII